MTGSNKQQRSKTATARETPHQTIWPTAELTLTASSNDSRQQLVIRGRAQRESVVLGCGEQLFSSQAPSKARVTQRKWRKARNKAVMSEPAQVETQAQVYVQTVAAEDIPDHSKLLRLCRQGRAADVQRLCQHKPNLVNLADLGGTTPLHAAAAHGHDSTVHVLVQNGACVNLANRVGQTPLHFASYQGHDAVVRRLVQDGGALTNHADHEGMTPLHAAALQGHAGTVRVLVLECDASVDQSYDKKQWTALHTAACHGHVATVRALVLECGADVNIATRSGRTALHVVITALHVVIKRNVEEKMEDTLRVLMMECGISLNQRDEAGRTALHEVAVQGHLTVVKLMVELKADANAVTDHKQTALMLAAYHGHGKVAKWLARHTSVELGAAAFDGRTAADVARDRGHDALAQSFTCSNTGCSEPGRKKCSVCQQVYYCGAACQKADWKAGHKRECKK